MRLSEFYEEHFAFVWASLRRLGVAGHDLEDVTHDVFVVVHRRRAELSQATSPRGWLFGITRRVAANDRRGAWRRRRRVAALADASPRAAWPEPAVDRLDAAHVVTRFIDSLAAPQREAFVLFELQQHTAVEVADILGINPNTAAARLRAARKAFHRFAEEVRGDDALEPAHAIEAARREDRPPAEARQRVSSALGVSLAAGGEVTIAMTATTTSAPGVATPTIVTWAKAAVIAIALGGGTLGAVAGVAAASRPDRPKVAAHPAQPPAAAPVGTTTTSTTKPPAARGVSPAPQPAAAASIVLAPAPVRRRPPQRSASAGAPPPAPTAPPSATPSPPEAAVDALTGHTEVLRAARAALASGDTEEALAQAHRYHERYRGGPLSSEIDVLAVRAHCAAGHPVQAKSVAARVIRRNPHSPHVAAIGRTCAAPERQSVPPASDPSRESTAAETSTG